MGTDRLNHIENLERGLTMPQSKKLEEIRHNMALALAREYGNRLAPMLADKITAEVILRPEVLARLEGASVVEVPVTHEGWAVWARDAVNGCELSQRCLASSDDQLRQRLTDEVVAGIPPERRMSMARAGTLDEYVGEQVETRFEQALAAGYGHGSI